jgi:hypothetical protein
MYSVKERVRELVDVPEKIAIGVGVAGLTAGALFPTVAGGLINPSLLLIATGGISLGVTRAIWPKKEKS